MWAGEASSSSQSSEVDQSAAGTVFPLILQPLLDHFKVPPENSLLVSLELIISSYLFSLCCYYFDCLLYWVYCPSLNIYC